MQRVGVIQIEPVYPATAPYHPSEIYPEYPFGSALSAQPNGVYRGVRRLLFELGLDADRYGHAEWNPFRELIAPGMTVVIKPNFVLSRHRAGKDLFAIITHPSLLRAVADYAWIALRGRGRIVIADAPQYDCNWPELLRATQLEAVAEFFGRQAGPAVKVIDLRGYWSRGKHFASELEPLAGDPEGCLTVDLGRRSALFSKGHPEKLYGARYDRWETISHHRGEVQQYEVSGTILGAEVVICVPKLKVHKKVGVTLNAKGLVGICTNKNYLVHYSLSPPSQGGDQYPDGLLTPLEQFLIRTERWMYDHLLASHHPALERLHRSVYALHNATTKRLGLKVSERKRLLDAGNWHGNDSAWRMTVDLMRIFYFSDRQGRICATPQRRTFSIIDGVIGGDHNGPLTPDPVASGVLIGGENLLAVDLVAVRLMGFDPSKMALYRRLLWEEGAEFGVSSLDDIRITSQEPAWANCLQDRRSRFLAFTPHPGWLGHLEVRPTEPATAQVNQSACTSS